MKRKIYISLIVASAIACMAGCKKQKLEPIASEIEIPTVSGEAVTELVPIGQEGEIPTSANVSADVQAFIDEYVEYSAGNDIYGSDEERAAYCKNTILLYQKYDKTFNLADYTVKDVDNLAGNARSLEPDETDPLYIAIREHFTARDDRLASEIAAAHDSDWNGGDDSVYVEKNHANYPEGNPEGVSGINSYTSYYTDAGDYVELFPFPYEQSDYLGWTRDADYIWDYIQSKFPGITGVYDAWYLPETYNEGQDFLTIDVRVEDVRGKDYVLTFFYNFTVHGVTITCPELDK